MSSLFFPLASLLVSLLLVTIFYNRKRQDNAETNIYSKMLLLNLAETLTAILIIILAKTIGTNSFLFILDRLDFILITLWCSNLFVYVYNVSFDNVNANMTNVIVISKLVFSISLLMADFKIINYSDIIDTSGLAPILVSFYCGFFAVAMLFCLIARLTSKQKKIKISKYYPLFVFIVLILLSLILRKFWPTMVLEPFMISFINLIMFFTIENPDLKMIEELTIAKEQAEKYGNEKTVFLFNMSQNVRRPLNNIEILTEQISNTDDISIIKNNIIGIKSSVQQLQYLVNNSLDISTIEARNLRVMDEKYDLRKIVQQIQIKVNSMLTNKNIDFNVIISETLPSKFYGDSIRIKQILNTLLLNSVKHTENGFIELNISSIVKYDVCRLIISVEDSGLGMRAKDIDKIFEKHDIDECSTDDNTLRLDTLKKLINYIGGTIMVESEPKKGTRFIVTLDQKIEPNDEIEEDSSTINKRIKVMLITDDDTLEKQFIKFFSKKDYDIVLTKNGEEALNKLRSGQKFDLIYIDNDLKKLDYLSTFNRMKEIKEFVAPVIVITDKISSQEKISLKSKGFKTVLEKPLSVEKIKTINSKYL